MGLQGNLRDMGLADLIQHNCRDGKTARLVVQRAGQEAALYFEHGQVVHASLGQEQGEEVVFEVLSWEDGTFRLETGIVTPAETITRSWSALLLEGARRIDEGKHETDLFGIEPNGQPEVNDMAPKLEEILREMSGEVTGYVASALVGVDGINIASHAKGKVDPDAISAQMTMLLKLVDGAIEKLGAGILEDNLTTSENAYILMRFLPGKQYYLGIAADRKNGQLGNMRLMSRVYADRLVKAMPRA